MSSMKTNGMLITIASTGEEYHTYDDWGLILTNNNYIGDPEQTTDFIAVKGRNGLLDISEALNSRPVYKSRPIKVELGGIRETKNWDAVISDFRNKIEGRQVKIVFDNDPTYYWQGRCHITGFDRVRTVGTFTFEIPYADPYKYNVVAFNEDWLWDPFSFIDGVVTEATEHTINNYLEVKLPMGRMPVSPTIIVTELIGSLTVEKYGENRQISLSLGENKIYAITVNDNAESTLIFRGNGKLSINYRGGSL